MVIMKEVYCSECGKKNTDDNITCESCGSTLKTDKIIPKRKINSFEELITEENLEILINTPFTPVVYKSILEEIVRKGYDNFIYDENASVLDNVYKLAEQYTHIYDKHKGNKALGLYSVNNIYVDERMPEAEKITTIIHELTHHLYYEIYEQWLMYVFNVEKSVYIESFVLFMLNGRPDLHAFNEYIAHTTQAQFEEPGCQTYSSFISLRNKYELDMTKFIPHFAFGRSVSDDIKMIIEYYIKEETKQKIIQQFDIDNIPKVYEIQFEDMPRMDETEKIKGMQSFLVEAMAATIKNKDLMENLETFNHLFE